MIFAVTAPVTANIGASARIDAKQPGPTMSAPPEVHATVAQLDDIRHQMEEANYSRLELILSAMGLVFSTFGIAATILMIVIAIRVDRRAVATAERALDERKGALDAREREAEHVLSKIKAHEADVAKLRAIAMKAVSNESLSTNEADKLDTAFRQAIATPQRHRDQTDILALIAQAATDKDWAEVLDLSYALGQLPDPDDRARCSSHYHAAVAWFYLGKFGKSLEAFEKVIADFDHDTDPDISVQCAKARLNRGHALNKLGRFEEAINQFETLITRWDSIAEPDTVQRLARARIGIAYALDEIGMIDQSISQLNRIILDHEGSNRPELKLRVCDALYNKACGLARKDMVRESIAALRQLRSNGGEIDPNRIDNDPDFDRVRQRPSFQKLIDPYRRADAV